MYRSRYIDNPAYIEYPPPPVPYIKGQRFSVRSHNPPAPEPRRERGCRLTKEANLERLEVSPLQRCLVHPPLVGSSGDITVDFKVSRELKIGRDHKAQVAVVDILQANSKALKGVTTAVAKFYDPLYFDHSEDDDPFVAVDYLYTYETASYDRLSDLQGTVIPAYYGSYSLELPVSDSASSKTTRSVRLILMELIHGPTMRDLNPEDFSQEERKRIMKLVIDGESTIYTRNIVLVDLHPRNVLVEQAFESPQSRISRVVHIDFEANRLSRYWADDPEEEQRMLPWTYISPLLRWHKVWRKTNPFADWVDWDYEPWLETEFAHTAEAITPHMRKEFLPRIMPNKKTNAK